MPNYFPTTPSAGVDLVNSWTPPTSSSNPNLTNVPPYNLGWEINFTDNTNGSGGMAVSVIATGGAIAKYDFVGIDENFVAQPLTKALALAGNRIGVASFYAFASGDYGFVAVQGHNINGNVLASCAKDVPLFVTSTAGSLDDAAESSTFLQVHGVVAAVSVGTLATNTELLVAVPMRYNLV